MKGDHMSSEQNNGNASTESLQEQLSRLNSDELLTKLPAMLEAADTDLLNLRAQMSALRDCVMVLVVAQGSVNPVVLDSIIDLLESVRKAAEDKEASDYACVYDSMKDDIVRLRDGLATD